jgi:hypothetical protein
MINKPIELIEVEGEPKKLSLPDSYRSHIVTFAYQYLQDLGWFDSELKDEDGYIPWYTYPAIAFLKDILDKEKHSVLEYGSGYSTLFYNSRVKELNSVDHNVEWAKKIVSIDNGLEISVADEGTVVAPDALPYVKHFIETFPQVRSDNLSADMMHGLANHEFAGYASQIFYKPKGFYNVVVIDGMARALCAYLAVHMLEDDAIIILDNSDRWQYNNIHKFLIDQGYGRLDFWGPGHGAYAAWCTSIFSKQFPFKNNFVERKIIEGQLFL